MFKTPWFLTSQEMTRFGNALLASFPGMVNVFYEEKERRVSFGEYRQNLLHREVVLGEGYVSFRTTQLERLEEWSKFNLSVLQLLHTETDLLQAKFNLLQARQTVYVPIRDVPFSGKHLFGLLGNPDFMQRMEIPTRCKEIGTDLEFAFPGPDGSGVTLILRIQTPGPTHATLPQDQILLTLSATLDATPETVENIVEWWGKAEEALLGWLSETVVPSLIRPWTEETGK